MNPSRAHHFYKMHGAGNDFILIDNRAGAFMFSEHQLFRRFCQHHSGVGADGLMLISPGEAAHFRLDYYNADGFPADMCGNGARCAVFLAHQLKIAPAQCSFEINGRVYRARVLPGNRVRLQMQEAKVLMENDWLAFLAKPEFLSLVWVDTGVPHLVITLKDTPDNLNIIEYGRHLRHHWLFRPHGTNVNFIHPLEKKHLQVRVYERGVENETMACGTGAVACGIVAARQFGWSSPVTAHFRGGDLQVEFDKEFRKVHLNGEVFRVFDGEFDPLYFDFGAREMLL